MDNDERRTFPRTEYKLKVAYTILSHVDATPYEFGETITKDISRSGVRLLLQEPIKVPQLVQLRISIPKHSHDIFILSKTVHCELIESEHIWEAGFKFVGLLPPNLEQFLEEKKRAPKRKKPKKEGDE